ncbi:hypothetical protein ON010_g6646 [Phytophthora cinnamomi]|nr:hypothetical protein ON010_g6646 [Phytophthora cinnamomi]
MSEGPNFGRKLWLAEASSSQGPPRKAPYGDVHHSSGGRPVPVFSKLCNTKKVAPTPPSSLIPTMVSTQTSSLASWPSQSNTKERRKSSGVNQLQPIITFRQAFGALGIPLLVVVSVCIVWTTWLVYLSVAPNKAANLLMNTGDYDNGNFWLIVERQPVIKWTSGLVLRRSLNEGLPRTLVYGYATFVAINGLTFACNIIADKHTAFTEVLIDSLFDFSVAVLYPIAVLGYCYYHFSFDRAVYLVNAEVLPDGNFERYARMQADPAQVALFLINFNSLRISGVLDFILSVGLNFSFCYRFVRVISVIITQRCRVRRMSSQNLVTTTKSMQHQRSVPHSMALVFIAASVCVGGFTYTAVTQSRAACATYPECVAYAHIWNTGDQCPCIIMIDGDRAPRTAQEWNFPEDVTSKVRALAESGRLNGLQLINRQLRRWPDELRRCSDMRTMYVLLGAIVASS